MANGEWDPAAYARLEEIGKWMKVNQEAVYDSEADPGLPKQSAWVFTRKGNTVYAIYQVAENESLSGEFSLAVPALTGYKKIRLLGSNQPIRLQHKSGKLQFQVDPKILSQGSEAWVFAISRNNF